MKETLPDYYVGIDPGIVCGLAFLKPHSQMLHSVRSCKLHELYTAIEIMSKTNSLMVFIENPNTFIPFKNVSKEFIEMRRQGAGAVKQTYKHIIEFLEANSIPYRPTRLQGNAKKMTAAKFKQITGWDGSSNEHGRDAAMLVYGR
jgi:hypothetical protein